MMLYDLCLKGPFTDVVVQISIIMWASLEGCIKRCTSFVCLFVYLFVVSLLLLIHSKSENHGNFKFGEDITLDTRNWG